MFSYFHTFTVADSSGTSAKKVAIDTKFNDNNNLFTAISKGDLAVEQKKLTKRWPKRLKTFENWEEKCLPQNIRLNLVLALNEVAMMIECWNLRKVHLSSLPKGHQKLNKQHYKISLQKRFNVTSKEIP